MTTNTTPPHHPWIVKMKVYAEIARWHDLTGAWLLILPCFWGMALAAGPDSLLPEHWLKWIQFGVAGILMRSVGCIWNDIIDRNIDAKVKRTANRPLASNHLAVWKAVIFSLVLASLAFMILLLFNTTVLISALLSLPLIIIYPFSKRWFKLPQIILGLCFSWGAWLGWFAIVAEKGFVNSLVELSFFGLFLPPLLMYLATFWWIVGYDTIYAVQDAKDDKHLPIGSSAVWLGKHLSFGLLLTNVLCITFFALAAMIALAPFSRLVVILPFALHICIQSVFVKSDNAKRLFRSNVNAGIWACLIIMILVAR